MTPTYELHRILPVRLPTPLVVLLMVALVAAWVWTHVLRRKVGGPWSKWLLAAAGLAVGFLALLAAFDLLQRAVSFATNWWLWPIALGGALVVEALLALYALERRIVPPRVGFALAALRVAIALLIVLMLAQPVRSVDLSRTLQRFVAVLVDDSASMHVPDKQLSAAEKMRLAEVLSPDVPSRPWRIERVAAALKATRGKLGAQADWFASLRDARPDARQRQLEGRRKAIVEALAEAEEAIAKVRAALVAAHPGAGTSPAPTLPPRVVTAANTLRDQLTADAHDRLRQARALLASERLPIVARDPEPVLDLIRRTLEALPRLEARALALGDALDEAYYGSLAADERAKVDAVALKDRFAIAQDLLYRAAKEPGQQGPRRGILGELGASYGIRLYSFAAKPVEVNLAAGPPPSPAPLPLREGAGGGLSATKRPPSPSPLPGRERGESSTTASAAALPPEQQKTDIAAALEKVGSEMPEDRLAGIVLLTDGQHNAASRVEPLARRFGAKQVPINSIVFGGGARPTIDAAVVGLEAPETVYAKDKVYIHADLKLDGLAGRTVRVTLYDRDQAVDSEEVRVEGDRLRTRVQLADEPREGGLHAYRVKVEEIEGEVLASNNERALSVSVTDDQTRLLVVEGRPRWEFRYLKNLFASRDRTVKLQYVVLHPDEIPGQPPRRRVHASAARPKDEPEATALPESEAEWMKFDVIVLGDVEPSAFKPEEMRTLKRFVEDRGGTLIAIAGPRHMPHAYAATPLADVLPVALKPVGQPPSAVGAQPGASDGHWLKSPDERFRFELTPEGREHVITRLAPDPKENLEVWASLPDIYWRHPRAPAKEGTLILAYALPPTPPDFMRPRSESEVPSEETIRQRQQYVRDHALIVVHNAALGRAMFLGTDHSWRLRYRIGDTHHHRFWGQVLRWATADKLPAGTSLVRLGTDRPRYTAEQPVRVRARLTQPDLSPVRSDDITAVVYPAAGAPLRQKMEYVANSLGLYSADFGTLEGGTYRVELDGPAVKSLLAAEGAEKVSAEFFVEPAIPQEQVELSANRGLLERVASLTGGAVADPAHPADALAALREPTFTIPDHREWSLWNTWPLLVLIVALAGIEWFIRKRARLA